MEQVLNKRYVFLIYLVLALATTAAYWQVRHNDFVSFDDNEYIYDNDHVKAGLTREGIVWAFTRAHANNWHPLTWLSHMLDCQLFGTNPLWHHLTNLLFHIANALLLFWVLKRMTNRVWPSAFVAAAFALHPLHVESVAWASERKDVLSTFFWMLTIAAYIRYVERPCTGRYLIVLLALCLGLMAKQMLITLPFVLLLLDYWPLRRLVFERGGLCDYTHSCAFVSARRCILEKLPLLIPSVAAGITVYLVQEHSGVMKSFTLYPVVYRIENAPVAYVVYIVKMLWPSRLAVFYPHPLGSLPIWKVLCSTLLLVFITGVVIWRMDREPYLVVGWLWYIGTLVPVIGLIQLGNQEMADRYTYVPSIGIFVMAAWGAAELLSRWRYRQVVLGVTAGVVLALLLTCTRMQVRHWQNSLTLYEHAIDVTLDNAIMHNILANQLSDKGRFDDAVIHFNEALRINPYYLMARHNKGKTLLEMGKTDEAIALFTEVLAADNSSSEVYSDLGVAYARKNKLELAIENYNKALELKPDYPNAHYNLGSALSKQGKYDDAIKHYIEALRVKPDWPKARHHLAMALKEQGKVDQAIGEWERALKLKPNYADAHFNLGLALAQQGKYDDAVKHFVEALKVRPKWAKAYYCMGLAYARQGKFEQAVQNYKEAVRIDPNFADAHSNLGMAQTRVGNLDEAIKHYTEALRLEPDRVDTMNNLAWLWATAGDAKFRNSAEAVKLAERACELTEHKQPEMLDTLAVAYAAAGRFSEAIDIAERAIGLAEEAKQKDLAAEIKSRLKLYKAGQPYYKALPAQDNVIR
jgi:tetratricopeptide (TPR) repeat protein